MQSLWLPFNQFPFFTVESEKHLNNKYSTHSCPLQLIILRITETTAAKPGGLKRPNRMSWEKVRCFPSSAANVLPHQSASHPGMKEVGMNQPTLLKRCVSGGGGAGRRLCLH